MPDTDPIAALRFYAEGLIDGKVGTQPEPAGALARAALEHYRWVAKPTRDGYWWWRRRGKAGPGGIDDIKSFDIREWSPDYEWAPVLPPPPREGE